MTVTYSSADDLLIGDLKIHDPNIKVQYLMGAAREINGKLGSVYELPINLTALAAHSLAYLQDLSTKIASGRLVMSMAVGSEDGRPNAYGWSLLQEGLGMLKALVLLQINLDGATKRDSFVTSAVPATINYDAESAIDAFEGVFNRQTIGPRWRRGWHPGPNP